MVGAISLGATQENCASLLDQGQAMLSDQRSQQARQLILPAIRECPDSGQGYDLLGISYDQERRFDEARRAFQKAISLNPGWAGFHNNLAVSYSHSGNEAAATAEFQKALQLDPQNQFAALNLAEYYVQRREFQRALQCLQRSGAGSSQDPTTLLVLVRAYFGAGSISAALETARELSAIAGSDSTIHFELGKFLAEQGQHAEAVNEFQLIPLQERDVAIYENLGTACMKLGRATEAKAAFETAMRMDPHSEEPYLNMAQLYLASRQFNQAIFLLSEAKQRAPQRVDITYALAEVLIQARSYGKANELLSEAIMQHPSDSQLFQALGDLYDRQHLDSQALHAYQQSLQIDPNRVESRSGLARVYQRLGKVAAARSEYQALLRLNPSNGDGNEGMGEIAFQEGRLDEAIVFLEKAFAGDSPDLAAGELLANARIHRGEYTQAEETLRKLIHFEPDNPRAHYLLGRTLVKLGKMDESEMEMKRYQELMSRHLQSAR